MITQFIHHVESVQISPPEYVTGTKGHPAYYAQHIAIVATVRGEKVLVEIDLFAEKHANLLSLEDAPA